MSLSTATVTAAAITIQMALVTGGEYRPLYMKSDSELIFVPDFMIDVMPVTNEAFYRFSEQQPQWQKQSIPSLFAESNYLAHWSQNGGHWTPKPDEKHHAVVNISWFAADAYCHIQGKRLPSVDEWEYAGLASETRPNGSEEDGYHQRILDWYAKPVQHRVVGQGPANYWGIKDLHGVTWEWTQDFNSALTSGESRGDSSINTDLYCAAAATGSSDPSDYAAFMRYGFRSSLQARFTLNNLGFRCAQDINKDSAS
jgi:formylglycine-generating enzyme required for sulfatase activity